MSELTKEDFQTWLNFHQLCFPSFAKWLNEKTHEERSAVLENWRFIFQDNTLDELLSATRRMDNDREKNSLACFPESILEAL